MLRSRSGTFVTSRPPSVTWPASMCSNPASRRKSVDFPQPDGPEDRRERARRDVEGDVVDGAHVAEPFAHAVERDPGGLRRSQATWMPHSVLSNAGPAAGPRMFARRDAARAVRAADARIAVEVQRVHRNVVRLHVGPDVGFGPIRERRDLEDLRRSRPRPARGSPVRVSLWSRRTAVNQASKSRR